MAGLTASILRKNDSTTSTTDTARCRIRPPTPTAPRNQISSIPKPPTRRPLPKIHLSTTLKIVGHQSTRGKAKRLQALRPPSPPLERLPLLVSENDLGTNRHNRPNPRR